MRYLSIMVLATVLAVSGCTTTTESRAPSSSPEITKSPNDERDYRYLELDNGLRVVLISAPKADKSAASLTVFRGSFDDPQGRNGLAHFLEHMLFIGTEKYPEPDGYFKFIQANGGSSNAYTASEHTNYFFDIKPEAFREGLDRFAQFFISPLFQKEYVEREKNAVNSEYQMQIKQDGWRTSAVQKVATNPAHPVSEFNIGTLETLSGDIYDELIDFFENNYSANQMGLVVLSNETLDEMEPWVSEMFAPIENRNLAPVVREPPMFKPEQLPATLRHDNLRDHYAVEYTFTIPSILELYHKKPTQYLSNLLGHEGEGSLHKLFTEKGWINSLAAGAGTIDARNSIMSVDIELTQEGFNHIPEITGYLFEYLDMLRDQPVERWLYEEQATVAGLGFRFREKSQAISAVSGLSPSLQHYPAEDLLVAPYLMEEFDGDLIRSFLDRLTPDNVMVTISSPGYEGSETERWFGVSYDLSVGEVPVADVEGASFQLPEPNPFLPDSLELVEDDGELPNRVLNYPFMEVYLDTDTEFGVPRAVTHVSLRNPGGLVALEDATRAQLYATLVQDDLNALAYPALLAGVGYQIASPPRGFRLTVTGYHDKQLVLLDEVLKRLTALDIDPERFRVLKAEMLKDLANTRRNRPFQQVYGRLQNELMTASWTAEQIAGELETVTLKDLEDWRQHVLKQVAVQALLIGNVTNDRVTALAALLEDHLELGQVEVGEPEVLPLADIRRIDLEIDHDDAAMVLFVQDDSDSFADRARSALLTHLIAPDYFASLRTDQQLGYVVSAVNPVMRRQGGVGFVIQSPVVGVPELRKRSLDFLAGQVDDISSMSEEEFGANKAGLMTKLLQREKNLGQRASRYWLDLDLGILSFDSRQQLAKEVSMLTRDDMLEFLAGVREKFDDRYMLIFTEGRFASVE